LDLSETVPLMYPVSWARAARGSTSKVRSARKSPRAEKEILRVEGQEFTFTIGPPRNLEN
jgi:hypothetical protein